MRLTPSHTPATALAAVVALLIPATGPAHEPPTPKITLGTGSATVSWAGGGKLESTTSLDSGWSDAGATSSPHVIGTAGMPRQFFRVVSKNLATVTTTISGGTSAPADLTEMPIAMTLGGVDVDLATVTRPSRHEINFNFTTYGLAPGDYTVEVTFAAPSGVQTGSYTVHSSILLLIVDDWGHDASPLDNMTPDVHLAKMPHLATLASQGLRFTNAYSQPTCSPMRATMLTGRNVWQHDVGVPDDSNNFSTAEITLPEIFTTTGAPHDMLSVGKWHLAGSDDGYSTHGGWPEFYGITGGAVPNFSSWPKNSNGTSANTTVYSTTDQVNEAKTFIDARVAGGTPWFAWVAFNAAHTPFHDPPAELAPDDGYSTIGADESTESHQFRKMLEALDTEMGRLLESIDPAQTNIILIGDNGTAGQVVQEPYGAGHAKGSIYNGGTHVPMIAKGPAVSGTPGSTSDKLVHCIDVFSTILELAGIDEGSVPGLAAQGVGSTSIVPILNGTDTADRCVVAEKQDDSPARAIILDDHPEYKLVIIGDPDNTLDDPGFEFYNIGAPEFDLNEQSPLDIGGLSGTPLAAYNACIAKDAALGGGYSDPPSGSYDTIYIELPDTGANPEVPTLTRPNGNTLDVTSVTVDDLDAYVVGRFDSGALLSDETDDQQARYWVKARIAPSTGGPYTTAHVVFPDLPEGQGGGAREFDSITILVNPNP